MNIIKTIIIIILVFISIFIQAQKVSSYFETVAVNSVKLLLDFKDVYIKSDTTNIYYIIRVLESSKKNRLDYYIEYTYDKNIAIQFTPDFYINHNDIVHILILNDSKQELASPLLPDNRHLLNIPDNRIDISRGNYMIIPIIYYFSAKWHSKKDKIEINYCYKHFPEIDIKDRPIRKYIEYSNIIYDTMSDYYPLWIQRSYMMYHKHMIPDKKYNRIMSGKIIIDLEESKVK